MFCANCLSISSLMGKIVRPIRLRSLSAMSLNGIVHSAEMECIVVSGSGSRAECTQLLPWFIRSTLCSLTNVWRVFSWSLPISAVSDLSKASSSTRRSKQRMRGSASSGFNWGCWLALAIRHFSTRRRLANNYHPSTAPSPLPGITDRTLYV